MTTNRARHITSCFVGILLFVAGGCGFRIVQTNPVTQIRREKMIPADPATSSFAIDYLADPNAPDAALTAANVSWPDFAIEPAEPVRLSFRGLEYTFGNFPMLTGRLADGSSVIVEVDTGCSLPMIVTDSAIRKHDIPVYPLEDKAGGLGVCDLAELSLGDLTLRKPPCLFLSQHLEFHITHIPVMRANTILLGLPTLRQFSYVRLDDTDGTVTFSRDEPFAPTPAERWVAYPMTVVTDPNFMGERIIVTMPLAGEEMEINFDSGGGNLVLKHTPFERLRPRLDILSEHSDTFIAFQHGPIKCRQVVVRNLTIGARTLGRVKLYVLPDDTNYMYPTEPGCLSLKEFLGTAVTLDFQNNQFWVK